LQIARDITMKMKRKEKRTICNARVKGFGGNVIYQKRRGEKHAGFSLHTA